MSRFTGLVAFCLLALVPARVGAQPAPDRAPDFAIGYSLLHFTEGYTLPLGRSLSVGKPTSRWVSIVGDVDGHYRTESGGIFYVHTFQGGVRVRANERAPLRPFAQMVGGVFTYGCCGGM